MARRKVRYYFGRLNIIAQRVDKDRLLTQGVQPHTIVMHRGLGWGFFKVATLDSPVGEFVHGFVVKYKPETEEEVAIPETHDLDDKTIENKVRAKARFFLHVPSHIIAYHPVGQEIPRDVFVRRFVELFEAALGNFFVKAEILPIDEPHRLREAMKRLEKISRIFVYLHPSNPSNRDIWRRTDERLQRLKASSYREDYQSDGRSEGLEISDDEELESKIAMAEDGYGRVDITGQEAGENITVSTRDMPVTTLAGTDDEDPEVVLNLLAASVRRILQRFTSE